MKKNTPPALNKLMDDLIFKIENKIWNSFKDENRIGLLTGLSGTGLFYNYLYKVYKREEYADKLLSIVEKINTSLESEFNIASICSGTAGYGLLLLELDCALIDLDEAYLLDIDDVLLEELHMHAEINNYDFMHGAMGIAMYFVERSKKEVDYKNFSALNTFFTDLVGKIESDFESVLESEAALDTEDRFSYYFGIAHGVAGYINFLIYYKENVVESKADIDKSLDICIEFLHKFKSYSEYSKQFYPNLLLIKSNTILDSRLSWCQGDLGIANALYNASVALDRNDLRVEAEALINNCRDIYLEDSLVRDFGICHGSTGILMQYFMAEKKIGSDLSVPKNKWLDIIENQTNGFETFLSFNDNQFNVESNLLEGMSGLGIVLLSLEEKIDLKWLRYLNLH